MNLRMNSMVFVLSIVGVFAAFTGYCLGQCNDLCDPAVTCEFNVIPGNETRCYQYTPAFCRVLYTTATNYYSYCTYNSISVQKKSCEECTGSCTSGLPEIATGCGGECTDLGIGNLFQGVCGPAES